MTRVLNAMDPETAALIRARIAGKPMPPAIAKAPKSPPGPKAMVTQLCRHLWAVGRHELQLPVYLDQSQTKDFVPPPTMSDAKVRQVLHARRRDYQNRRDGAGTDLEHYFPNGIHGLTAIEYVRFSRVAGTKKEMDDDNLGTVFKPIRDALCSFVIHGRAWREHIDIIGNADGLLKERGVRWRYRQMQNEANPRAHGIKLILHCAPSSSE